MVARAIPCAERQMRGFLDVSARESRATVRLLQGISKKTVRGTFGFDLAGEIGSTACW
jgi:hypothetical protein